MRALLRNLLVDETAQDLIEYALLASLVSLISVAALVGLGGQLRDFFNELRLRAFPERM